ncbi:hypothetical protein QBC47DRAFT_12722 [Echria macrotheca]|uniref:Uncharacterized protein n=1 Tax=Echria macrotheca TaxID=438768 RepID=A0AAJ0F9X5_9PEZI|nr:hypothetical protein QBC47DRAFT_12722 [Echria macrotheca]
MEPIVIEVPTPEPTTPIAEPLLAIVSLPVRWLLIILVTVLDLLWTLLAVCIWIILLPFRLCFEAVALITFPARYLLFTFLPWFLPWFREEFKPAFKLLYIGLIFGITSGILAIISRFIFIGITDLFRKDPKHNRRRAGGRSGTRRLAKVERTGLLSPPSVSSSRDDLGSTPGTNSSA